MIWTALAISDVPLLCLSMPNNTEGCVQSQIYPDTTRHVPTHGQQNSSEQLAARTMEAFRKQHRVHANRSDTVATHIFPNNSTHYDVHMLHLMRKLFPLARVAAIPIDSSAQPSSLQLGTVQCSMGSPASAPRAGRRPDGLQRLSAPRQRQNQDFNPRWPRTSKRT